MSDNFKIFILCIAIGVAAYVVGFDNGVVATVSIEQDEIQRIVQESADMGYSYGLKDCKYNSF